MRLGLLAAEQAERNPSRERSYRCLSCDAPVGPEFAVRLLNRLGADGVGPELGSWPARRASFEHARRDIALKERT